MRLCKELWEFMSSVQNERAQELFLEPPVSWDIFHLCPLLGLELKKPSQKMNNTPFPSLVDAAWLLVVESSLEKNWKFENIMLGFPRSLRLKPGVSNRDPCHCPDPEHHPHLLC